MKIQWLGHSCFKLSESTGTSIITDPYDSEIVGYSMPKGINSDIVTVSHSHKDHSSLKEIEGEYILLNAPENLEVKGVTIVGYNTFHDNAQGLKRGSNIIFKYRIDGLDVCHMGDIGEDCNADIVNDITPVDVLMIPVGGKYTIDAEKAKAYVDALMPDIVIPIHYKTKDCDLDIDKIDSFIKLFDAEDIIEVDDDNITIDRDEVCHKKTKVYILRKKT
ncbi:MAG: MBL fold metallo-hydrolase [Clostridia bacterium]